MAAIYFSTTLKYYSGSIVALAVFAALSGCSRPHQIDPMKMATIQIERKPNKTNRPFSRGAATIDVLINNVKVGTLDNGRREAFPFETHSPQNTLQVTNGNDVSQITEFEAAPNSTTSFICRYLEERDKTGYDIVVRPAGDSETSTASNLADIKRSEVKVLSVTPNPQLQSEVVEKYPAIVVPVGVKQSFTRKVETYDRTAIIDTEVVDQTKGINIGAGGLLGPIALAIKNAGINVRQVKTTKEIKEHMTKTAEVQSLEITGNGKPKTLFWRRNYQVGTVKVMVNDKTFDVPFKVTKDSFLLAE